jgi:hypothetical protein
MFLDYPMEQSIEEKQSTWSQMAEVLKRRLNRSFR